MTSHHSTELTGISPQMLVLLVVVFLAALAGSTVGLVVGPQFHRLVAAVRSRVSRVGRQRSDFRIRGRRPSVSAEVPPVVFEDPRRSERARRLRDWADERASGDPVLREVLRGFERRTGWRR